VKPPSPATRIFWLTAALGAVFAFIAGKLIYIQGFQPASERYTWASTRPGVRPGVVYQPGLRGKVLDARGDALVQSQLAYHIRANPVFIGPHAAEVAAFLAPLLGDSPARLRPSLTPEIAFGWHWDRFTNTGGLMTNRWVWRPTTNQHVLVASNLTVAEWETVRTNLPAFRLAEERRLLAVRSNLFAWKARGPGRPWWDVPAQYSFRKRFKADLRKIGDDLRPWSRASQSIRQNGVSGEIIERRLYPHGSLATTVLGLTTNGAVPVVRVEGGVPFAPRDLPAQLLGADGIERQFNEELLGTPGEVRRRTYGSHELAHTRERDVPAHDGHNVRLTIDATLQYVTEDALRRGAERLKPNFLAAVMVRPRTGEILAMANVTSPDYLPPGVTNPAAVRRPIRRNHVVSEAVEPGSTFKVVTYAAALNEGRVRPDSRINCDQGTWRPPYGRKKPVQDARGHKLGVATVEEAFAQSSNVGAAKLGFYELWSSNAPPGPSTLVNYARAFGFTQPTGIACGGEPRTRIPAWDGMGTQLILSYGYGLYVTPLQVAMAYAAIANGGVLMEPVLVRALEDDEGRIIRSFQPVARRRVVSEETARQMTDLMKAVVSGPHGTGREASLEEHAVAGKTGTANKMTASHVARGANAHFSTFVGFFPAEDPQVCLLVCADEPKATDGRAAFGAACAPIFREIARETASYLAIPPSPTPATNFTASIARRP
jgi:cell division protein FtsI/penicillin-binding protein 2